MESFKNLIKYKYHDTPDGQDVFKKLFVASKYATGAGLVVGTLDVMLKTKPKQYITALGRYAYFTGPFLAMATSFTATSHLATTIRNKDDELNYILGAISSGLLFGVWRGDMVKGTWAAIILSAIAAAQKTCVRNGTSLFNKPDQAYGSVWHTKYDWSLIKDTDTKGYVTK